MEYPTCYYDAVHSRDAFLHIHEKTKLFGNLAKSLKPGGKLLVTDYCCKPNAPNEDPKFVEYIMKYNYDILTIEQYKNYLRDSGFENVVGIDNSKIFLDILKKELKKLLDPDISTKIRKLISKKEYNEWCDLWKDKIKRVECGGHIWGLFTANKPF